MTDKWSPITVQQVVADDLAIAFPGTSLAERIERVQNVILIEGLTYCEARVVVRVPVAHTKAGQEVRHPRKFCGIGSSIAQAVAAMRSELETGLCS